MTLNTKDLITLLSQSSPPQKPLSIGMLLILLTGAFIVTTTFILGLRTQFTGPDEIIMLARKIAILSTLLLLAALALNRSSTPVPRSLPLWPAIFFAGVFLFLIGQEWMTHTLQDILALFDKKHFGTCLAMVSAYGAAGAAVMALILRHYAPADIKRAAWCAGLAASAAGAVGYALHCPVDSATFILISSGLPTMAITLLSYLVMPRFIRW